jgi:hypothetical protein
LFVRLDHVAPFRRKRQSQHYVNGYESFARQKLLRNRMFVVIPEPFGRAAKGDYA